MTNTFGANQTKTILMMKKDIITIEVEGQHIVWNNELNEINEELNRFEAILSKIAAPTNKKKVEHFQNQFIIQRDAVAKLKNEIKKHDFAIEREGQKPFDSLKEKDLYYHETINQKVDTEIKIFNELKKEYAAFVDAQ